MSERLIVDVIRTHASELMSISGVVGVAQGDLKGEPCVTVMVVEQTDEMKYGIPGELDGFPVVISETGKLRAQ